MNFKDDNQSTLWTNPLTRSRARIFARAMQLGKQLMRKRQVFPAITRRNDKSRPPICLDSPCTGRHTDAPSHSLTSNLIPMSQFWSKIVHSLTPYVPGEQPKLSHLIKLNTNECPYGPSPKVLAAIKQATNDDLRRYPDPNADALKNAVANYYSVASNQVFVGNGSDEILAHTFYGLLQHDKPVLFPDITYS